MEKNKNEITTSTRRCQTAEHAGKYWTDLILMSIIPQPDLMNLDLRPNFHFAAYRFARERVKLFHLRASNRVNSRVNEIKCSYGQIFMELWLCGFRCRLICQCNSAISYLYQHSFISLLYWKCEFINQIEMLTDRWNQEIYHNFIISCLKYKPVCSEYF